MESTTPVPRPSASSFPRGAPATDRSRDVERRWFVRLLAVALLAAGFLSMLHVSRENSPVWDEMHFWGIGRYLIDEGRFDIPGVLHNPPLSYYLNSLPLLGLPLDPRGFSSLGPWATGEGLFLADVMRGNRLLRVLGFERFTQCRIPFIVTYCLLAFLVFRWAQRWWGDAGGLFSLALALLSPNLMAHGFLLTTDTLTCTLEFAMVFSLVLAFERPGPWPLVGFVAAFALAPAAKYLGLIVAPLAALCVTVRACWAPRPIWVPARGPCETSVLGFFAYWTVVGAAATLATYLVLVGVYQGDWRLQTMRHGMGAIAGYVRTGHPVFLDGRISRTGFRTYYAKAVVYKTPLTILLAWALAPLAPGSSRIRWLAVAGLSGATLAAFSFSGYTLGLRYPLMAFPLAFVAAGRLAAPGADQRPSLARLALCGTLLIATLVDVASFYPYPRSFVNRIFLGGRPGFSALAGTDLDWGEGLVALARYVRVHSLGPIAFSENGAVLPGLFGVRTSWYENPSMGRRERGQRPASGLLFVSATNLAGVNYGVRGNEPPENHWAWLRSFPPLTVLGGSIYVYDLDAIPTSVKEAHWLESPSGSQTGTRQ